MEKLQRSFFNRPTIDVAKQLLGKEMVFYGQKSIITETEAYVGKGDPACHAARGKTKRTEIMFGLPGFTYVYFIYGMYYCLNFVTEEEGFAAAVLIRGVLTQDAPYKKTNGPGKLCRHFGITKEHNAVDLIGSDDFYLLDNDYQPKFDETPRIGISKGQDKLWRFVINDISSKITS